MKVLLVDDEYSNRMLLANLLNKHCPDVEILGDADSADTAYEKISELKPDLIFLDIKMPGKNGFDLLKRFEKIDFSVIFVTGFDEYALKAFEFNAIDYILKPIDYCKLIAAVKKAAAFQHAQLENILHFVHSMEEKSNYIRRFTIHGKDRVHVIDLDNIVYIAANRGYCEILDTNNQRYVSAKPLSDYAELLEPVDQFLRVNKSYIININHIDSYTKGTDCVVFMKNCVNEIEVSRRKKTEILNRLKQVV